MAPSVVHLDNILGNVIQQQLPLLSTVAEMIILMTSGVMKDPLRAAQIDPFDNALHSSLLQVFP